MATTDALKRRLVHGRIEDKIEELWIVVADFSDGDQRNDINRLADLDIHIRSLLDLQDHARVDAGIVKQDRGLN